MDEENTTPEAVPGGDDVTPAEGGEAVSGTSSTQEQGTKPAPGVKDVIGQALGKEFKDDESALKSVKDTFSYVGKNKDQIKEEVLSELKDSGEVPQTPDDLANTVKSLNDKLTASEFYAEHPEYKEHKDLISQLGGNPADVVESEVFKSVYAKIGKASESEEDSKSVLQSNQRIAGDTSNTDYVKEVQKAEQTGDWTKVLEMKGVEL